MNAIQITLVDDGTCVALARRVSRCCAADGTARRLLTACFVSLLEAAAALVALQQHEKDDYVLIQLFLLDSARNLKESKVILKLIKTSVKQYTHKRFFRNFFNRSGTEENSSAKRSRIHKRDLVLLAWAATKAIQRLLHNLTLEQAKALYPKVKSNLPQTFLWPVLGGATEVHANDAEQNVSDVTESPRTGATGACNNDDDGGGDGGVNHNIDG